MKFGSVPTREAMGAMSVHALSTPDALLKKGCIIDAAMVERLLAAGIKELTVARFEPGDIGENEAARAVAEKICGANMRCETPFAGRCNLRAQCSGLFRAAPQIVDAVNEVDEAVTIATLRPWRPVAAGELAATVKIIPFAVPQSTLTQALASAVPSCLFVSPFRPRKVGVVSTLTPGFKASIIDKTLLMLERRLHMMGGSVACDLRVAHAEAPLGEAIVQAEAQSELVVIFGASAIADRRDVLPAAILKTGGAVEYFGMPVDPGNLLLLARGRSSMPIIGAPGCARAPALNGFDFVLQRIFADILVTGADLKKMGVGGLLKEIPNRPLPREKMPREGVKGDGAQ